MTSLRSRVIALASGTGLGQLAVVLAGPVLTRLYGPAVIGDYARWFALVAIAATFASLRWEYVLPSAAAHHRPAILRLALLTTAGSALVVALAVAVALVAGAVDLQADGAAALWLAPAVALQVAYLVVFQWSLNTGLVEQGARGRAAHGLTQAVAQSGLGLVAPTATSMILGYVMGPLGGLTTMWRAWRSRGRTTAREIRAVFHLYWRTPLLVCLSGALNAVGVQLPILVLGLRDVELSGQFAIATRSATAPLVLVGVAVSQVFLAEVAAGRRDRLPASLVSVSRRAVPVLLGLTMPLATLGPQLTTVLLGAEWEAAGHVLRVMAPALLMVAFSSMTTLIPISVGRARGEAVYQGVLLVLRGLALVLALPAGPMAAVAAYAAMTVACLVGYSMWCFRIVGAELRDAFPRTMRELAPILATVLLSVAGWALYASGSPSPWWSLPIAAVAALPPVIAVATRGRSR